MEHGGGVRRALFRVALLGTLFVVFTLGSYRAALALRGTARPSPAPATRAARTTTAPAVRNPFRSGRYLIAYVLVSSKCGYSTERQARRALRALPDSLRATYGPEFAKVSVIGVALDENIEEGIDFLGELGRSAAFDEISVGRSWLNEQVVRLVWREGMATANLPQVVLVARQVDARPYPRHIETNRDSVLLTVTGRNDLVAWIGQGVPLTFRPTHPLSRL